MSSRLVEKQVLYSGKKVKLELHHLEDDQTQTRHIREVVVHAGAVVVMGILPDQRIILIRTRRYAVGQILVELPAGTLERNEDPINCAGRELLEETGYLAGRLRPIGNFYTSPGILSEKMYAFVAYDLEKQQQALEEGEEIELEFASLDDAIEMIRRGEIHDGKTIAALLMYDKFFRSGGPAGGSQGPNAGGIDGSGNDD
jgi:ADP-ribose pyrophosphatase